MALASAYIICTYIEWPAHSDDDDDDIQYVHTYMHR